MDFFFILERLAINIIDDGDTDEAGEKQKNWETSHGSMGEHVFRIQKVTGSILSTCS